MQAATVPRKKLKCFKCDIIGCHHAFRTSRGLINHLRKHLKSPCSNAHQTASSTDDGALSNMATTNDGEGVFHCKFCSRVFTQSSNLLRHERIHRGEKPHECVKCGKKFSTSSNLKQHALTHQTADKRSKFVCKVCKNSYLYRASLKKHMRQHMYLDLSPEQFASTKKSKTSKNNQSEYETQTKKVRMDASDSLNRSEKISNSQNAPSTNILGLFPNMRSMVGLQGSPRNMNANSMNSMMNPFLWALNGNIQSLPINPNFWSNPQGHPPIQNPQNICPFKDLIQDYRVSQGLKGFMPMESGMQIQRGIIPNNIQSFENKGQQFPLNVHLSNLFARISETNPTNTSRQIYTPSGVVAHQMTAPSDPIKKEEP